MHKFENLQFWQRAIALAKEVYISCRDFPSEEKYGLEAQMKRAAVSIPSNIAEGAGRNNPKEFNHFLAIALGSAFELQTQIIISRELDFLEESKSASLLSELAEIQKMIYAFKNKLTP